MLNETPIKIPLSLLDWTVESIQKILDSGIKENQFFDFKRQLPDPRDLIKKDEFRVHLCALANSYGGFLVIGVDESERKIVGVDPSEELIPQINDYQKNIIPSISYDFKTLQLTNGNIVYILHIPTSRIGPHALKKNDGFIFKKRSPGSNTEMTYEEVRLGFMLSNEKISKLKLLLIQLGFIAYQAERGIAGSDSDNIVFPLALDMTILNLTIGDVYSLISEKFLIITNLSIIIAISGELNLKVQTYFTASTSHGPILTHNIFIKEKCNRLKNACEETIKLISNLELVSSNVQQMKFKF